MTLATPDMLCDIEKLEKIIHDRQYALAAFLNDQSFKTLSYDDQLEYMKLKRLLGESYFDYVQYTFELDSYHEKAMTAFAEAYQLDSSDASKCLNTAARKLMDQNTDSILPSDDTITHEKLYLKSLAAFLGCGEEQNANKGFRLLNQAAIKGSTQAQTYLGIMYRQGIGVANNETQAFKWLTLASTQDACVASAFLGIIFKYGVEYKNEAAAFELFQRSAEAGCAYGQYFLGKMYNSSSVVSSDNEKFFKFNRLSAEVYQTDALGNVAHCYRKGYGVPKNDVEAFKWNTLAIAQGNKVSMYNLGLMYLDATCFLYDEKIAWNVLRQAVEAQNEIIYESVCMKLYSKTNPSIYRQYHALMHKRKVSDAAMLIIRFPDLLEVVVCFDPALNEYYNSDSPSDINSMMIELNNIKQFGLLNDLCFKAASAFNWKILDHLSSSPDPLENQLSDLLSNIDTRKMSDFNAKTFDQLLSIFILHLTRITNSNHMDTIVMYDKCMQGLLKCISVADGDELKISDSATLMFLGSTLIQKLYGANNKISLDSTIDHSDIMILVMTIKHRPHLEPHQLNILLGKDLILPCMKRLLDQPMTFYHKKQKIEVDESLSDLAPEHRTRG